MRPLYVVKVGSSTLARGSVFAELAHVVSRPARLLLVAGGGSAISEHYRSLGRPTKTLRLKNGDEVRYCPPEEMHHIVAAYEDITLPAVETGFADLGLSVFATISARGGLVEGRLNRPLRTVPSDGRGRVIRDHRAGVPHEVARDRLLALLDAYDVVCLSSPIADGDGGTPLNADADVLAAVLSNALGADHLRLVTGTAGILRDPYDPRSTLSDAYPGEAEPFARGRMRQKVRAADIASTGSADVAITGPHTLGEPSGWTRFWPSREPEPHLTLLTRAVGVPSVSGDEHELATYLAAWCGNHGIDAHIDPVGNLVATRGSGPRRLLMLGHLDTVPHHWPITWRDGELSGRGSVDAKASLTSFLEVLAASHLPPDGQLRVVGAVEEEVSSSKGAFYVRDHYPADAVVIGEPSGPDALTLGYYGLLKVEVTAIAVSRHSAATGAVSAADLMLRAVERMRADVLRAAPSALSSLVDVRCASTLESQRASAVVNFRVPPEADLCALEDAVRTSAAPGIEVQLLRATPGFAGRRSTPLVRAFRRGFQSAGMRPRYVVKKGTSDMNTLATTWRGVPMVAYGPGDSALDHTAVERIGALEYAAARTVLSTAVQAWFRDGRP